MNLYLVFHGRFPSEKAASLFAAKSCEAFADRGLSVTLVVPRRLGRIKEDFSEYYGIKKNFNVIFLPTVDLFRLPILKKASFAVSFWVFSFFSFLYLILRAKRDDIVYSNETLPLFFASFIFPNTAYEMHDFPRTKIWVHRLLFKRVKWIIATNQWKKNKLAEDFKVPKDKILFESNAVDVEKFKVESLKSKVRTKLELPKDKFLIGYVGMLKTMGMEKGIDTALKAIHGLIQAKTDNTDTKYGLTQTRTDNMENDDSPRSPLQSVGSAFLLVVGGNEDDIEHYKQKAADLGIGERVMFVGWVSHELIPEYLAACDAVIAPFPQNDHYNFYMSPMKIFEYMASRRPIVASDLNSIREIITDGKSGILVKPSDPKALADGIRTFAENKEMASRYVEEAYEAVLNHTWDKRVERILGFMKKSPKV